ncbi:hypothetical protein C9J12_28840 [Photobacterium frigidiphilum]|uniref:Apea-like HEPN domain-containing protein n=1 Tax=Photobacterium frigidiphilum TaxID=264736 RepID=A0A2T3J654_9GAMM|nr:hypothetical protein [Photobacterium frigidiphilum]PSU42605.1 hypothetical protein C9J12_28840 [Photobacterium frigidiphilum]
MDHDDVIRGWEELEEILSNYDIKIDAARFVRVSIDSSEVRDKLFWLKPENCDAFFNRLDPNDLNWLEDHPLSADFHIEFTKDFDDDSWCEVQFVERLLEQIFLVLNVAVRGGCNYGSFRIGKAWKSLHCSDIESGWHYSSVNEWPVIERLSVIKTWQWFEKFSKFDFILADTAVTKASAVLLHLAYKDDIESTDILQLSQVIENFYLVNGEPKARGLNRKIPVVLGRLPDSNKKLIQNFYKLRSDIAHGDFPLFRPRYRETDAGFEAVEKHYWEISQEVDKGIALVIATLQFLVRNGAERMVFKEEISVETNG